MAAPDDDQYRNNSTVPQGAIPANENKVYRCDIIVHIKE